MVRRAKTQNVICGALVFLCFIVVCISVLKIRNSFEAQVQISCSFPQYANYMSVMPASPESMEQLIRRDELAYNEFTKEYSEPVHVSVLDVGWTLYLNRVWKTDGGYITLSSGGDPRDYEISISYSKHSTEAIDPQALNKNIKTITQEFLKDHGLLYAVDKHNN